MAPHSNSKYLGSAWQNEKNIQKIAAQYQEKKYLFFIFSYISLLVLGIVLAMVYYIMEPGLARIQVILPVIAGIIFISMWVVLIADIVLMTGTIMLHVNLVPYYHSNKRIFYFMPFIMRLGMLLNVVPDRMISSFIAVNNALIKILHHKKTKETILILLPRCLQHVECTQPVVTDINFCKSCGKCDIVKLVKLSKQYNLVTAVATGGGLARSLIREIKPHGVIAIACERELMEGLKGVRRMPIVAISNRRPEGPCKNTKVDIEAVEKAIKLLRNI